MRKNIHVMACVIVLALVGQVLAQDEKILLNDLVPTHTVWKLRHLSNTEDGRPVYKTGFAKEVDVKWVRVNDTAWRADYKVNPDFILKSRQMVPELSMLRFRAVEDFRVQRYPEYDPAKFITDLGRLGEYPVVPGQGVTAGRGSIDLNAPSGSIIVETPEYRPGLSVKMGFGTMVWDTVEECVISEPLSFTGESIIANCDVMVLSGLTLVDSSLTLNLTEDYQHEIIVNETGWFNTRNTLINTSSADYVSSISNYGTAVHENLDLTGYNSMDLNHYGDARTTYINGLNKEGAYAYMRHAGTSETYYINVTVPKDCSGYLTYFTVDYSAKLYADNLNVCPTSGSQYFMQYTSCKNCLVNATGPNDALKLNADWRCYAYGSGEHCLLDGYVDLNEESLIVYALGNATRVIPSCAYTDGGYTPVGAGVEYQVYYDGSEVGTFTTDADGCVRIPVNTNKTQEDSNAGLNIFVDGVQYRQLTWSTDTNERDKNGKLVGILIENVNPIPEATSTTDSTTTTVTDTTSTTDSTTTTVTDTTSTTDTTATSTTTQPDYGEEYDAVIKSKAYGIQILPANGRLSLAVSGFTMQRPDGQLVCCGPDIGNHWVCVSGVCG